jgi:hypothetical protein
MTSAGLKRYFMTWKIKIAIRALEKTLLYESIILDFPILEEEEITPHPILRIKDIVSTP